MRPREPLGVKITIFKMTEPTGGRSEAPEPDVDHQDTSVSYLLYKDLGIN